MDKNSPPFTPPYDIMAEFMAPYEDHLQVIIIGDRITKSEEKRIQKSFNSLRREFTMLPNINSKPLEPIVYSRFSSSDLFRGKVNDIIMNNACVIFLDEDLSKDTLEIMGGDPKYVDELEAMLIKKFIMEQPQEKFIFDVSGTEEAVVNSVMDNMDQYPGEFNYLQFDHLVGVWIYYHDDNTLGFMP